jgi:hypothetical protein
LRLKSLFVTTIICLIATTAISKRRSRVPFKQYSIFIKQPKSEVVISIKKNKKGHILIDYKSLTKGKKVRKRISKKNYRYFTKGFKKPLVKFEFSKCPDNYFIVNSLGECLHSQSSTAKSMRSFLRKIFNHI